MKYIGLLAFNLLAIQVHAIDLTFSDAQLSTIATTQVGVVNIAETEYVIDEPTINCLPNGQVKLVIDVRSATSRLGLFQIVGTPVLVSPQTLAVTEIHVSLLEPEPYFKYTAMAHIERWNRKLEATSSAHEISLASLSLPTLIPVSGITVTKGQLAISLGD